MTDSPTIKCEPRDACHKFTRGRLYARGRLSTIQPLWNARLEKLVASSPAREFELGDACH